MLSAIVAVDSFFGIGYKNDLLISIPDDLKHFKEITSGHTVVMGSNTWLSLPRKPLPNRTNIVLSRKKPEVPPTDHLRMTQDEFNSWLEDHQEEEVFIMGGAKTYADYIDKCDRIYLTQIYKEFEDVDAYFPNFYGVGEWRMSDVGELHTYNNIDYRFITYDRIY